MGEHSNIVGLEPEEYYVIQAYAYLLQFKTPKGKNDALKATAPQTTNRMPKAQFLSLTNGQTSIKKKKKKNQQDIYAKWTGSVQH